MPFYTGTVYAATSWNLNNNINNGADDNDDRNVNTRTQQHRCVCDRRACAVRYE